MQRDWLIVGGGLQGAILALALRRYRPSDRVTLLERADRLGGNHLWSFHAADVPAGMQDVIEPLVVARWPAYDVVFPDGARRFDEPYASISSDRLEAVLRATPGLELHTGANVTQIRRDSVELAHGAILYARRVVDARGPVAHVPGPVQKFCGVELRVARAPELPVVMDARGRQDEGFRFTYVLPLARDRVLVEETRFSLDPSLHGLEQDALAYAARHGLDGEVVRSEQGILPLPLDPPAPSMREPLRAGYGGGFFHPTTGYSLPAAVRLALALATGAPFDLAGFRAQQRFAVLLNRLLYVATGAPDQWAVMSRFHRLPAPVIRRFYALETTRTDRARILCGRPPRGVSIRKAIEVLTA